MPEYLAPGVFVEELSGGVKPIAGVSTSTIGIVGVTEPGPVNCPTLVTNAGDFAHVFGGFLDHRVYTGNRSVLPYAVQGAFDNGAGRIHVDRILGTNAAFAVADLFGSAVEGAAATALAERAAAGATLLRIDDGAGLAAGDRLLLYVTAQSDPLAFGVALTGALHADQADDGVAADLQDPSHVHPQTRRDGDRGRVTPLLCNMGISALGLHPCIA